jgi:hypothetical protein
MNKNKFIKFKKANTLLQPQTNSTNTKKKSNSKSVLSFYFTVVRMIKSTLILTVFKIKLIFEFTTRDNSKIV